MASSVRLGVLMLLAACHVRAAAPAFTISDEFVRYIESATNPEGFGLGKDGRFMPYSTPQGRRIGYRQAVWDEALYAKGCTKAEAETRLRADLQRTLADVRQLLATNVPPRAFESLTPEAQEILVDLASSEGAAGLKPEAVAAVAAADWDQLVNGLLYVRSFGSTLDNLRNRAFAQRWIESGRLGSAKSAAPRAEAAPVPEGGFATNTAYRLVAAVGNAVCVIPSVGKGRALEFRPRFTVFATTRDPQLALRWGDWGDPAEKHLYNVLTWSTCVVAKAAAKSLKSKHVEDGFDPASDQSKDADRTMDVFKAAPCATVTASRARSFKSE